MTSPFESLDFYALLTLLAGMALYHLSRRDPRETFAPPVVVAVVFLFYAVLAPRDAYLNGETHVFFRDALPFYPLAWRAVVLHLLGFLFGYHALTGLLPRPRSEVPASAPSLADLGYKICVGAIIAYAISQGFDFLIRLNPLSARSASPAGFGPLLNVGLLTNYFSYAINFLLLGILFQLPAAVRWPAFRFKALAWIALTTALFINFAFRWRLIILFAALFMFWYLWRGRRPRAGLLLIPLPLVAIGAMGINRQYGAGLDTEAVAGLDLEGLLRPTLGEGKSVLNMTALLIEDVQQRDGYVGIFDPLLATLSTFIPRQLIPGKDIAEYLKNAFIAVFGDPIAAQSGLAVLNTGEYFLIAGWLGVILAGVLIGALCRLLWNWYRANTQDPLATCLYTLSTVFLYLLISRGFLPGSLILAGFTFLPFLVFRRQLRQWLTVQP